MNYTNSGISIPKPSQYSHFTKLSQPIFEIFIRLYESKPEIRSSEILVFLQFIHRIKISKSWVNQILSKAGCKRPLGRPPKSYTQAGETLILKSTETFHSVESIGIPFLITIMEALGLLDVFINTMIENLSVFPNKNIPKSPDSLGKWLRTIMGMVLDQRIHNFEEAKRSEMPHKELNLERCRQILKALELQSGLTDQLVDFFLNFIVNLLGLEKKKTKLTIFIDGHGNPYYTKQTFVSGRMSVTEKIAPGTHTLIVNCDGGYLLFVQPQAVNTHLNDGLLQSCARLKQRLGDRIEIIVVDRECNGTEINQFVKEEFGYSILTGLRANQYNGLDDFNYEWVTKDKFAIGQWKDKEKRQEDQRIFLLYPQGDHLYTLVTTSNNSSVHHKALKLQKSRWPFNEGIIKILVHQFDFNVNAGNGSQYVENPKLIQCKEDLHKKNQVVETHIEELKQKLSQATAGTTRNKTQDSIENWKIRKKKNIKKYNEAVKDLPEDVKTRQLESQGVMSQLKAGMFNVLLFLIQIAFKTKNPLKIGVEKVLDLLTNRGGEIIESGKEILFIFNPPDYQEDREVLYQLFVGINKLNLVDPKGRRVRANMASRGH